MTKRFALLSAVIVSSLMLSACANTIRGAGRDVSNTVDATGAAANDVAR